MANRKRRKKRGSAQRDGSIAADALKRIGRYLLFTLVTDWQRDIPYVPRIVLNWVGIGLAVLLWSWVSIWWIPALFTLFVLGWTITRAGRTLPRRAQLVAKIYESTQRDCGHPRSTITVPVDPRERVKVRRWGKGITVRSCRISYTGSSPAAKTMTRRDVEITFESSIPVPAGEELVFDWETRAGEVRIKALPDTDLEVLHKHELRRYTATLKQAFSRPDKQLRVDVDEWGEWDSPDGPAPRAQSIRVMIGDTDLSAPGVRQRVEHTFDEQVRRDGVWVYDWSSEGYLDITHEAKDSEAALKKGIEQKINALATGLTRSTRTAVATAHVVQWASPEGSAPNTPTRILIDFATLDVSSTEKQEEIEKKLDDAFRADWKDRVWLYDWEFAQRTVIRAQAVPNQDPRAQRKIQTKRLQSVAAQKFPTKRNVDPVRVEVLEWHQIEKNGRLWEKPKTVRIDLSTYDVTDPEVRFKVEAHYDVLYGELGWHYDWEDAEGIVTLEEVPALPRYKLFPEPETEEFERLEQLAASGIVVLGPAKGGGEAFVDYNKVPHSLYGGNTGAGKSVALNHHLFWGLWFPDQYDMIVCDPKRTDFTWTVEFPNVRFAATIPEITEAVRYAFTEMNRRQDLLRKHGVRNIGEMAVLAAKGKIPWSEVPKRLVLFFDEIASFLTDSKDEETVVLQGEARTHLEQVMMLGRAPGVNVVGAAQKPSNENMGTQIRELFGNRIGIGWMKDNMSMQVLGNPLCSRLSREKTPKGRGWVLSEGQPDRLVQTMYMSDRTDELIWAEGEPVVTGLIDRIRDRLTSLGYTPETITNEHGRQEQRWQAPEAPQEREQPSEGQSATDMVDETAQELPDIEEAQPGNLDADEEHVQSPAEPATLPDSAETAPAEPEDTPAPEEISDPEEASSARFSPENPGENGTGEQAAGRAAEKKSPVFDPLA